MSSSPGIRYGRRVSAELADVELPLLNLSARSMPPITTAAVRKLFNPSIGRSRCLIRWLVRTCTRFGNSPLPRRLGDSERGLRILPTRLRLTTRIGISRSKVSRTAPQSFISSMCFSLMTLTETTFETTTVVGITNADHTELGVDLGASNTLKPVGFGLVRPPYGAKDETYLPFIEAIRRDKHCD